MKFVYVLFAAMIPLYLGATDFDNIDDFTYQLQGYSPNLQELTNGQFDLVIPHRCLPPFRNPPHLR